MAQALGIEVDMVDFGLHAPLDPERIGAALRRDNAQQLKAVLISHVDTSTSFVNDVAAVRPTELDRLGHPALLMVDLYCLVGL